MEDGPPIHLWQANDLGEQKLMLNFQILFLSTLYGGHLIQLQREKLLMLGFLST
jgi:hypothetical protein